MPAPTLPLRREPRAWRNLSRPSGVVTISTCGAPAGSFPSFSSGSASPAAAGTGALSSTFTGVSSAASTSPAASAAIIASSNPAALSRAFTRATALSTQPAETSVPSSMPMSCAGLLRPDPLFRARRPGIGAVHPQAPLKLREPQLQPAAQLALGLQPSPQALDLRGPFRHHGPQPRVGSAKPRSVIGHGLVGHAS